MRCCDWANPWRRWAKRRPPAPPSAKWDASFRAPPPMLNRAPNANRNEPAVNALPVLAGEANALFADLAPLPGLLLAVSGGPDSTALMLLAARWRDTLGSPPRLVAVTIDHGLR